MTDAKVQVLFADAISAAGNDLHTAQTTFFAGKQPFSVPEHFNAHGLKHGICPFLQPQPGESRAIALLNRLVARLPQIPTDTEIVLATTVGAIDCLTHENNTPALDCTGILFDAVKQHFRTKLVTLVSAACASGQTGIALALRALRRNRCRYALVIGLDITSEFVTSGFVSLGAVSPTLTRPYDAYRDGLLLGEGAGALLLSLEPGPEGTASVLAAGESCDAAHITAPNLSGEQLAALIRQTLSQAQIQPEQIGGIIGHGTGTLHNDQSEIAALNQSFAQLAQPPPLVSIKGTTGHTLAATGILQIVYGLDFLRCGQIPPQAGLTQAAAGAERFVSTQARTISSPYLLSLNVGFGGLNSALILGGQP